MRLLFPAASHLRVAASLSHNLLAAAFIGALSSRDLVSLVMYATFVVILWVTTTYLDPLLRTP